MWRVLLLAAAAATGVRDPLPSRIYWLHIPKCGSSFANTVVHWACDDVALNKSVSAFLGATPTMIFGEKCPRLHKNHSKHWGRHKDLNRTQNLVVCSSSARSTTLFPPALWGSAKPEARAGTRHVSSLTLSLITIT